jgi:GNAT superfamily N-acetyltransferase
VRLDIYLREAERGDAAELARLSAELGYPATPDVIARRLSRYEGQKEHAIFVACCGNPAEDAASGDGKPRLAGFIDVSVVHHLQAETCVEIGALVVDASMRSRRIGVRFLECADEWARQQGVASIRVRSNVIRTDAHRFYEREGYVREKTSAVFRKSVGAKAALSS